MATNPTMGTKPPDYDEPFGAYIGHRLVTTASVCMAISTIFVGLRIWTRRYVTQILGADDYLIGTAWVGRLTIDDIKRQCRYGTGTHLWELREDTYVIFLKLQMVVGTFYTVSLPFAKCSILAFYLRLSQERVFRILVYLTIGFIASYATSGVLVIIFSCNPVAGSWDLDVAALKTTYCINRPINYLAQSSFNIFSDLVIILLPVRTIWGLHMPTTQRLSIIAIFACGFFVCIVSIIRLESIITLLKSPDLTWDTTDVLIWSTIESHITILCACAPHLKPLVTRFIPGFLRSGISRPSQSYPHSRYPTNPRSKSHALHSSSRHGTTSNEFELYGADFDDGRRTMTVVESGVRARDSKADSQESILDASSKQVYVTRTVHVS
ncbi:hypothetical protein FQN55_006288 [Onygenales sp. PD_40]|nr:hypothetical protein FQN55_006288 [Onygenales sp. PD_40]KAK2770438.1 hypothetical protein FQN53_005549 [Emmonsiellopsis sp. PD_33]KAK2786680.1 hypothetical protein FQN52_007688 [Onygenales sp. PD_12]